MRVSSSPTLSAAPRAVPTGPERWEPARPGGPLALHVAGLALLLLVLVPLLGGDGLFSADEGAAAAQTRLLSEDRGWGLDHPLPALDPEGENFALEFSSPVPRADGGLAAAPFAKHPAYPVLLSPFNDLGGLRAMTLTSVLGTIAAAAAAGLLVRRLAPGLEWLAVWATGLATPLFVDSWILIAHTLGAALVAAATLGVIRADETRRPAALVTAGVAMVGAVLLRNEATLFGVALAVTAVTVGVWGRRRWLAVGGGVVLAATVIGYLVDGVLADLVTGGDNGTFQAGVGGTGFLEGRILGALLTLLTPSYGALGLPDMLLVLSVGALAGAVVVARRRPEDIAGIRLFAAVAALAAVGRAFLVPDVVPGLFVAAPALTAGLAAVSRRSLGTTTARVLAGTSALFFGAVLATQYASGGSGEWGGRYFALALPLLVPLAIAALRDVATGLRAEALRPLVAAFLVVALASALMGGRALRGSEERNGAVVDGIAEAAAELEDPVVVSTAGAAPRFAWEQVVAGGDWLLLPIEQLAGRLTELRADGRDVVLATSEPDEARPLTAGYTTISDEPIALGSAWTVIGLRSP